MNDKRRQQIKADVIEELAKDAGKEQRQSYWKQYYENWYIIVGKWLESIEKLKKKHCDEK